MSDEEEFYSQFNTDYLSDYSHDIELFWKLFFLKDFLLTKINSNKQQIMGSFEVILSAIRLVDNNDVVSANLNLRLSLDIFIKQMAIFSNIPEQVGKTFGYYNDQYFKVITNFLKSNLTDYDDAVHDAMEAKDLGQYLYSELSEITHGRNLGEREYSLYFNVLPNQKPEEQKECIEKVSNVIEYIFHATYYESYLDNEYRGIFKFSKYSKYFKNHNY